MPYRYNIFTGTLDLVNASGGAGTTLHKDAGIISGTTITLAQVATTVFLLVINGQEK